MSKTSFLIKIFGSLLLGVVFLAISTGCAAKTEDDSTIPWSRPASWEGQMPGFGG